MSVEHEICVWSSGDGVKLVSIEHGSVCGLVVVGKAC